LFILSPGDIMSEHRAASSRNARATSSESAGLGERGVIEGRNVLIEFRWANGDYARLPALAAELVGRPVSVLVAAGGPPAA
jgi:putative tryptophan/tyrosine transport system substrate-binding protein